MAGNIESDKIAILYKKYFTPELCKEPVTESKQTLKYELLKQLYKYGFVVFNKKITLEDPDIKEQICSNVVADAIENCFNKWNEKPADNCKAYFSKVIWNLGIREKKELQKKTLSIDIPLKNEEGDEEVSLIDSQPIDKFEYSKNTYTENLDKEIAVDRIFEKEKKYLMFINKCYKLKKRSDFLKAMITQELYQDLHDYFDSKVTEDSIERYAFIDETVYNWDHAPSAKEIASFLDKDEGQMSRAKNTFLTLVSEMFQSEGFGS